MKVSEKTKKLKEYLKEAEIQFSSSFGELWKKFEPRAVVLINDHQAGTLSNEQLADDLMDLYQEFLGAVQKAAFVAKQYVHDKVNNDPVIDSIPVDKNWLSLTYAEAWAHVVFSAEKKPAGIEIIDSI